MAACYCSYSHSEIISGVTPNAAQDANAWVMSTIIPKAAGLTVDGVVYRYTTIKQVADPMVVSIQNENALGTGFIFQKRDDWSGLPGNTISKAVPVNNIPIELWGNGSIAVEGKGTVLNPSVAYTYKYDTCFDPITDPRCPGYAEAMAKYLDTIPKPSYSLIDPLDDQNVKKVIETRVDIRDKEERDKKLSVKQEQEKERVRIGLSAAQKTVESALITADVVAKTNEFLAMNNSKLEAYNVSMPGGVYNESIRYAPKQLPDGKAGLRNNLAQQLLHIKLIDMQYR